MPEKNNDELYASCFFQYLKKNVCSSQILKMDLAPVHKNGVRALILVSTCIIFSSFIALIYILMCRRWA